jgi:hypothetical protein
MIETYEDIKGMIDEALDGFRRNHLSVVKRDEQSAPHAAQGPGNLWQTLQLGLCGTEVWRRIIIPLSYSLTDLHRVIQVLFNWDEALPHRFTAASFPKAPGPEQSLGGLRGQGIVELLYEYGTKWAVKVMFLSSQPAGAEGVRCVAGAGAAPPEFIDGPLRFKRFLSSLEKGNTGRKFPVLEKGAMDFRPDLFEPESCNRRLEAALPRGKQKPESR